MSTPQQAVVGVVSGVVEPFVGGSLGSSPPDESSVRDLNASGPPSGRMIPATPRRIHALIPTGGDDSSGNDSDDDDEDVVEVSSSRESSPNGPSTSTSAGGGGTLRENNHVVQARNLARVAPLPAEAAAAEEEERHRHERQALTQATTAAAVTHVLRDVAHDAGESRHKQAVLLEHQRTNEFGGISGKEVEGFVKASSNKKKINFKFDSKKSVLWMGAKKKVSGERAVLKAFEPKSTWLTSKTFFAALGLGDWDVERQIIEARAGVGELLSDSPASMFRQAWANVVLMPNSTFMFRWSMLTLFLLFYVCIVTPYEVAFLSHHNFLALHAINGCVDAVFMLDIVLNFFVAYYDDVTLRWIVEPAKIRMRYLTGWFIIDVISGIPWGQLNDVMGFNASASLFRLFKLMRFIKLLRILRFGRVVQFIESKLELEYQTMTLLKLVSAVAIVLHWETCIWRTIAGDNWRTTENWIHRATEGWHEADTLSNEYVYIVGLELLFKEEDYVVTFYERIFAVVCLAVHTTGLSYVIAEATSVVITMTAERNKFDEMMQQLNSFMRQHELDVGLRTRICDYMRYRNNAANSTIMVTKQNIMMQELSPKLRQEVAHAISEKWTSKVELFKGLGRQTLVELALALNTEAYTPNEVIFESDDPADRIFIIQRGVVLHDGKLCMKNTMFGERAMLDYDAFRLSSAKSMTYSICFNIRRDQGRAIMARHVHDQRLLRKRIVRSVLRRRVISLAHQIKLSRDFKDVKSLIHDVHMDVLSSMRGRSIGFGRMATNVVSQRTIYEYLTWLTRTSTYAELDAAALVIQRKWRMRKAFNTIRRAMEHINVNKVARRGYLASASPRTLESKGTNLVEIAAREENVDPGVIESRMIEAFGRSIAKEELREKGIAGDRRGKTLREEYYKALIDQVPLHSFAPLSAEIPPDASPEMQHLILQNTEMMKLLSQIARRQEALDVRVSDMMMNSHP
ncbi:potassium voltage-gated channel [Pseudoscourfieldia marina]